MRINIRKMINSDTEEVSLVERACFSEPWSKQAFEDALGQRHYLFYVAQADEKIVGMAGLIISLDEATVTNVAVLEEYRNKGIAGKILLNLFEAARAQGINAFTLEVREGNKGAIRLYEGLGFEYAGKRPGFYTNPDEDALIYWKRD